LTSPLPTYREREGEREREKKASTNSDSTVVYKEKKKKEGKDGCVAVYLPDLLHSSISLFTCYPNQEKYRPFSLSTFFIL